MAEFSWESRGRRALLIASAAVTVPFLVSGMFRLMPDEWSPLPWLP